MTKREMFGVLTDIVNESNYEEKAEVIAFIDHEIDLLNRKSASKSKTATQKANEAVMVSIADALAEIGRPVTITELQNEVPAMAQYSNQKLSALLRLMPNVVKTTEKKRSYFSIAE